MRIVVMTAAAIALLTMPAQAQIGSTPGNPTHSLPGMEKTKTTDEHHAVKADEKAYRSALDAIPKPKEAYDPWRNVRATPQSK